VYTQVRNLLNLELNNDDNYQDAYIAYLQIFDANNRKERKELLKRIILDPHVTVLFFKNCNPNETEQEIAFDSISNDIDSTFLFLKECNPDGNYREEALKILLCVDDYALAAVRLCQLSSEERQSIYQKYCNKWNLTTDLKEYFDYCILFQDLLAVEEIELLVDMIYENNDDIKAEYILTNNFPLSDSLKDKLESLFIIKKLKGDQSEAVNC
jgi:hypothetical protein